MFSQDDESQTSVSAPQSYPYSGEEFEEHIQEEAELEVNQNVRDCSDTHKEKEKVSDYEQWVPATH